MDDLKQKLRQSEEQARQASELEGLKDMLEAKVDELQEFRSKHAEMSQELADMDGIKHKLNEHIVYLQNEIRKRDELLESSEFEEDDQRGQEELREQMRRKIEENLRLERQIMNLKEQLGKKEEGLNDVSRLLDCQEE